MSNDRTGKRIAELVEDHDARRALPPAGRRAVAWQIFAVAAAFLLFSVVQPFRSRALHHLVEHPVLVFEVLSGLVFVITGSVWAFRSAVPGRGSPKPTRMIMWASFSAFALAVVLSFSAIGAESTSHGGRALCWLEVLVCGSVTFLALVLLLRRGYPRFGRRPALLLAVVALLPGALLMQLACAYDPAHGLLFHYIPMLMLVVVSLAVQPLLRR